MNVGYVAPGKATYEDNSGFAHFLTGSKDFISLRVGPPTSSDWTASNVLSEAWLFAFRGLQDQAVIANETHALIKPHEFTGKFTLIDTP